MYTQVDSSLASKTLSVSFLTHPIDLFANRNLASDFLQYGNDRHQTIGIICHNQVPHSLQEQIIEMESVEYAFVKQTKVQALISSSES